MSSDKWRMCGLAGRGCEIDDSSCSSPAKVSTVTSRGMAEEELWLFDLEGELPMLRVKDVVSNRGRLQLRITSACEHTFHE